MYKSECMISVYDRSNVVPVFQSSCHSDMFCFVLFLFCFVFCFMSNKYYLMLLNLEDISFLSKHIFFTDEKRTQ